MIWPKLAHSCSSSQVAIPLLRDHNISAGVILRIESSPNEPDVHCCNLVQQFNSLTCFVLGPGKIIDELAPVSACFNPSHAWFFFRNCCDTRRPKRQRWKKSNDPRISNPKSNRLGMGHWVSKPFCVSLHGLWMALYNETNIDHHKNLLWQ